jgi:DNA polymerase III alpha subunit
MNERDICSSHDVNMASAYSIILCAGLKIVIQAPPTAKGFRFVTLEDEFGFINVIIRPQIYEPYRRLIRQADLLMVKGTIQRERGVVNVMAEQIRSMMA